MPFPVLQSACTVCLDRLDLLFLWRGHQLSRHRLLLYFVIFRILTWRPDTKLGNIFSHHSVFCHSDSDASVTIAQIFSFPSKQFGSKKYLDFVHNIVYSTYKKIRVPRSKLTEEFQLDRRWVRTMCGVMLVSWFQARRKVDLGTGLLLIRVTAR